MLKVSHNVCLHYKLRYDIAGKTILRKGAAEYTKVGSSQSYLVSDFYD
ncbi:hypothetical protein M3J09_002270 [Ascochyta lentis]